MKLSILLCLYGNYHDLSLRAVHSVIDTDKERACGIYVGMNQCCPTTVAGVRRLTDAGFIDGLIESRGNLNKDPMMRLLIDFVDTPFLVWMDDDSYVLPGWQVAFDRFLTGCGESMDVAGHVFYSHRCPEYREFCRKRPWFIGDDHWLEPDHADRVWFATGGLWLARTSFLRQHGYPDRCMVKRMDDLLLGDLISQQHGRLIHFSNEIMSCIRISDAGSHGRRGSGEGSDGWLNVNPRTGM
jgi:hypothetical protein